MSDPQDEQQKRVQGWISDARENGAEVHFPSDAMFRMRGSSFEAAKTFPDIPRNVGQIDYSQENLGLSQATFDGPSPAASLANKNQLNYSSYVTEATYGGKSMYGNTARGENAQFGPPRLGFESKSYYTTNEQGNKVGSRPLVNVVDFNNRGGYSSDGGGYKPRSGFSDPFTNLTNAYIGGQISTETYTAQKASLNRSAAAPLYSGWRTPMKDSKRMLQPPVATGIRNAFTGSERTPATDAFPEKNAYIPDKEDQAEYYTGIQEGLKADREKRQSQTRLSVQMDRSIGRAYGTISERMQGPATPRGRSAPNTPFQVPEADREELKPYFLQAGVALARNTAASVGSVGGKLSHSTLDLVRMAQNFGQRWGVQQEDYAAGIEHLSTAVGSTHDTNSLITASLTHGVFGEGEADALMTNGAPDPKKIAGFAQAQQYIAIANGSSPQAYHDQLAQFATVRALNNGTYASFHPNIEAGAAAQEKYGPIVKRIEETRAISEVGSAMKWEKPEPVQGASDHKGDASETSGATDVIEGSHVSSFTDAQNPQGALAQQTSMEIGESFSTLHEALRAKAARARIADFQRTQLGFENGINRRLRTAAAEPGGIVTRAGMNDGVFGAQQTTSVLSPVAITARKLAALADQRGRGLSLRAIGNYETDSIVGAAMADTTDMPNSNALLRTAKAGSGLINGLPASAEGARQLARQTGQFRRDQQDMIDRAAVGGDIDDYEAYDYNKDSDADPSTAQQALGNQDYGIVDAFGTMGGFQPDPMAIALRQGLSAAGVPTNRKEATLLGNGRRGEALNLAEVADMLVQARGATVNNDPKNKDNSGDVLEPLYANGKSLVDILTQNPTDAPVFTERLSAPPRITPEQLAAETRSNISALLPEYQETMHPAIYGRIEQRLSAKNEDGSDTYGLKDIVSLQGEGHVNLMLRGGSFTGSGVQGERSNQAQIVEQLFKRSGDTARKSLLARDDGGIDYDNVVQDDLRAKAAKYNEVQGTAAEYASHNSLQSIYGVEDPALARVFHHIGSSTEGTLRQNMTAGLLGELATVTGERTLKSGEVEPTYAVRRRYADITRRVYDKPKKTNEIALDLLTPGDSAWMGMARDMSRQLAKGFGDPTKLHAAVTAGGMNPDLITELGHSGFADYLQGQQVLAATSRTGDLRGYQSFLDEHGKALDIKQKFDTEREFSDWLGGTAKSGAFIQGVGNPQDVMADRTRNSRAFLERVGMLADTGNISNEGLSGEMRTPKLSNNQGMADENVSGTKVSIKDITVEQEDRARRVQASIDQAKQKQAELRAAKKNLQDNHLAQLQSMGIKDPMTRNPKLQAAYEKKFHRMLGGLAEGMTEQQFQSNPSAKAMRAAIGFYDARTAAFNTKAVLSQSPITGVPDGRRVLDTLNGGNVNYTAAENAALKDKKTNLAEFMEVGISRLAQQNRGTPMQGSDKQNDYTMSRIREDFMKKLKGGTAQQAQSRLKKLMDLHDEWRSGDQRNGQPVFTEDHAVRLADALGARKDFIGLNFGAPKARRDQDNNFIYNNIPDAIASTMSHKEQVQAMVGAGLGMTKGAASAKMPVHMDAYSAAKHYHDTVFRNNEGQRNVMNANPNGLTVVNAGQGTGKTAANIAFLAQQAAQMREGDPQVLALSFSKPAEREVTNKLDAQLDAESRSRIRAATVDADAFKVYKAFKGNDSIKPLDSVEKQLPYMKAAMRTMKVGTSEAPAALLGRVNELVQQGHVGDSYLKSLGEGAAPEDLVAGHALQALHAEYDRAGVADFDTMKVTAAHALERDDKIREQFQPHNTTGTVDEAQDTRRSDLAYIKARFGKGLVAIGDNGQNLGADYRETVLNVGTALKSDWQGQINPDVHLTESMRQGSALVTATNALLGQENVGDATPGREGQFSYTSYTHTAGLSGEIKGQVGLFRDMLDETPEMLDGKTVSFITPTDRGRSAIKQELRTRGIPYMSGTGKDDEGKEYTAEQQKGRVIADTIHGVKGQTHDVTFGIGFGEGDMNLTLGGAVVPTPEELQAAVAGGEMSPGGRGMAQKAFMGNVAMGRSNTVHMSGSGAPSKLIEPALDALEALKPGAAKHRDYTSSEAIPASRGADKTNPRDIAAINADNLLMAGQTNRDTALTTDLGMLMPKDMQLAKGDGAFMAEQARRTLAPPPAMLQAFTEANKDRQPLDLPSVDMTWDSLQRIMRGEKTATTRASALGGRNKDGNIEGGTFEVHLSDRNYVNGPNGVPTGITLDFGDKNTQKTWSSFDDLTPDDLKAEGGLGVEDLKAFYSDTYGPGSFNRQGVPTGFRSQRFGANDAPKPDAAFLNRFTIAGISDTAAAFAMGGGFDGEIDNPHLPSSKMRIAIPDMPQTPHGMDTTRGSTAIDTRYLFSGSMGEDDNPWRNAMERHVRNSTTVGDQFQRKENIGNAHVTSDPEEYAAMIKRGATGMDLSQEAWANPEVNEERAKMIGGEREAAHSIGSNIGKGHANGFFKELGSALGGGNNVAILASNQSTGSVLQAAMGAMGLGRKGDASLLNQETDGEVKTAHSTQKLTLGGEVRGQPMGHVNAGVAGDDGIGQRKITDNDYVLGVTGPKGGDDFSRKDWEAAYMGTQALFKKRKAETEANGQNLRIRTGGTAGMDLMAGDLAQSMNLPLDLQLPAHPDDMAEMHGMTRADQARLHKQIDYSLKNGGSVSVNNRQVTRDADGKITTDPRALEVGQQGMIVANGGRMADEIATYWNGQERDAGALQHAAALQIPITNLSAAGRGARLPAASADQVKLGLEAAANSSRMTSTQEIKKLEPIASLDESIAYAQRLNQRPGREEPPELPVEAYVAPSQGIPETEGASYTPTVRDLADQKSAERTFAPVIEKSAERTSDASKFIRQAASMIPHVDKLLTGGVHLASQNEALAEAKKRFGDDATALRGWSDPKNGAVYVADQSHLGAEGNAMMAHTVAHEAGHVAIAQARRTDKGESNYQAAIQAFKRGPQGEISKVYKGEERANEGLADLFAQSVGARDFAGDPRAYLEPQAKHSRFSINPEFALKGLQAFNSAVTRFPKAFNRAFGNWMPQTAGLTKTGDELVTKVQGLPEANLPTDRPTGDGSMGPAQYGGTDDDDISEEEYSASLSAVKGKQKTSRGANPVGMPKPAKLPKEASVAPAELPKEAVAGPQPALRNAEDAFNDYTPPEEHPDVYEGQTPDANAPKPKMFSGNVVMGMEDFGNFVEGANQNKQVSSFHGLASMNENGGDLNVSRFGVRGSGTMQEGSRNRTDDSSYVFGRAESDRKSDKEAEILSIGIPSEDEVNLGVGIHYNPAEGKIAASYGGEHAKLMVQHGAQLLTAEQALGMRKAPIQGAASERAGNVAPGTVTGNPYSSIVNDFMEKTRDAPQQRAIIDAPSEHRIAASADAGTGKSFTLLGRFATLLKRGKRPAQMSYVSFNTEVADKFAKDISRTFHDPEMVAGFSVRTANSLAKEVVKASDPGFLKTVFGKGFDPKTAKTLSTGAYLRAIDPATGKPAEHIEGDQGHHPGDDVMMMWDTMQKGAWGALPADAQTAIAAQAKHEFKFGQHSQELDSVKIARYLKDQNNKILQGGRFGQEHIEELERMKGAGEDVTPAQMGIAQMAHAYQREQGERNRIGQEETTLAAYQSLQKPANSPQNNAGIRDLMSQFDHTIVDEAQDMSEVQTSMIKHLSAGRGMTIAGDKKQRIYSFRGAAEDFIKSFGMNKVFPLQKSRRNQQSILDTVNAAFDTETTATDENKGQGRVSYNHVKMFGQAGWEEENQRMAADILADMQAKGGAHYRNPKHQGDVMVGVPTHARLEHLHGLLAEPLKNIGVDIKRVRSSEQLDQDALNMVGMRDKPKPSDQDAFTRYTNARDLVEEDYSHRKGIRLGVHHQMKGLEADRGYMGGVTGEGSGQILTSQLATRLGEPGEETNDPVIQREAQDARNLAYVTATRPKELLRMYGAGKKSRFISRAASALGLDRYARNIAGGDTAPDSVAGTAASVSPPRKDIDMTPRTPVQQAVAVNNVMNPEALPADAMIAPPKGPQFGPQPLPVVTPAQKRALHLGRSAEFYQGMSPDEAAETRAGMEADIHASAGRRIVLPNEPAVVSAYHIAAQATGHELNNLRETPGGVTADVRTASTATASGKPGQSGAVGVDMPGGSGGAHIQDVRVTNAGDIAEGVAKALPQAIQKMLELPQGAAQEYFSQQGEHGQMAAAAAIGQAGSAGLLTPDVQQALAPHIAGLTAAARAQGNIDQVIPGLNQGNYDVANEGFRAPRGTGGGGGGSVPRSDFAVGGGDDEKKDKGDSRFTSFMKGTRGLLNGLHQFGAKEGSIYETDLKTGSEYDFLATRAAQATGQSRTEVDATNMQLRSIHGVGRIDAAQVQRFVSDPQQAAQVVKFAKLGGIDPGNAARDTRQLANQFNLRPDQAANIIEGSRNSGGTLDEKDLLQAAQATAPFVYRADGQQGGKRLAGVLAMSQALGDAGIDVDRGTRQLYQHMAMPDVVMATRLKQAHDTLGRKADPNVSQDQLDATFTSETYWNDRSQVAQLHNQVQSAPLRLTEMRSTMGLDNNGQSKFQQVSGASTYAQQMMQAPLANLSNQALDVRMQRTNIDAESRNLARQGGILDIQERMQGRQIQQERAGLAVQGMQIAQGQAMLGVKQEQFGLQKQENQISLATNRLDVASMQVRGQYAQEQSDLSYEKSNIEFRSRKRDLELEKRMLPAKKKQMEVSIQSQELNFQYQKEGIEFQRWYDTQMNGSVGSDRSYRSYLAMQGGQANEQREGGTGSTANASNYNQTKAAMAATPVMGLKNEQFYAGIEHQMSQLTLGRSSFRSEASFAENVSYLKKQTDMYERQMAIEDKAREFSYRMQDKQLELAKAQWEVQKELLKYQKEQLDNQIADAEALVPIELRLNEINHAIETAEIKQMPERIALALAGLLLKEKGIALSEKAEGMSLENEAKMLAAQGAQLKLAQAALTDQIALNKETNAARRDELATAQKNLATREEMQTREEALLANRQLQAEMEYALTADIAKITANLENSHNAIKDKGIGTENGQVMDFTTFAKTIAGMVKSGAMTSAQAERMSQSWTDPAMVAAVKSAMDGTLDKYEQAALAKSDEELKRSPGQQSTIDKAYQGIASTGGFDQAEWLATVEDMQIAMKHASDKTNEAVLAMERLKGMAGEAAGALHGIAGQVGDMSGALLSIVNLGSSAATAMGLFRLAGATGAATAAATAGTAGTAAAAAAVPTIAATIALMVGAGAILVIMDEVVGWLKGKGGGAISGYLSDKILGKDDKGNIGYAGSGAGAQALTAYSAQHSMGTMELNALNKQMSAYEQFQKDPSSGDAAEMHQFESNYPELIALLKQYKDAAGPEIDTSSEGRRDRRFEDEHKTAAVGGMSPDERGDLAARSDTAATSAEIQDIMARTMDNDPSLPVLKDIKQVLSSGDIGAGELQTITKALDMLRDDNKANDVLALASLKSITTNTALTDAQAKADAKQSDADKKSLAATFTTYGSQTVTNLIAMGKTANETQKGQVSVVKANDAVVTANDRLLKSHITQLERLEDIRLLSKRNAEATEQGFADLMKQLLKGAKDALSKGAGDSMPPDTKKAPPAAPEDPGAGKNGNDGTPSSVPTTPKTPPGGSGGGQRRAAIGIRDVPEDMSAFLHRGEAVLTTNEAAAFRAGADTSTGLPNEMQGILDGLLQSAKSGGSFADIAKQLPAAQGVDAPREENAPANLPSTKGDTYHISVTQSLSGDISPAMAEKIKQGTLESVTDAIKKIIKR